MTEQEMDIFEDMFKGTPFGKVDKAGFANAIAQKTAEDIIADLKNYIAEYGPITKSMLDDLIEEKYVFEYGNEKLKATFAMAEEHFHEPLPFVNEFDIAIREAEKQGGKKLRDAIINAMGNCNYMGVSYKWSSFSDNDIDSIFNEVFNNDKK